MRTIQKILWYKPIDDYKIELLRKWDFFNWTGADWIFFDDIINLVFQKLKDAHIFDEKKAFTLRKDVEQLVIRHDIDTGFKIWFLRANLRLAYWLYKLLHKFSFKYRFLVSFPVFYAVHFTSKAKNNYLNNQ